MTRTIDVIKNIYKPYRYTIKGKTTVLETTSGKFLVKEKGQTDVKDLYNYLVSRNFDNFPNLIDGDRDDLNVFEYVEEIPTPKEQKALDLVNVTSNLHHKTTYFKEVSEDKYKSIYEDVANNLNYQLNYYSVIFDRINKEIYMSPSDYLLIRNSSKILSALEFGKKELDVWYDLVKEKKKQRVSLVHNDLRMDHLIKGKKDYLISWEKSKVDTPIIDFINLYKNEYYDLEFDSLLTEYNKKYSLNEDEKKLLFIILSIPPEVKLEGSEFNKTRNVKNILDYIYKTEELIRPYYAKDEVVQ